MLPLLTQHGRLLERKQLAEFCEQVAKAVDKLVETVRAKVNPFLRSFGNFPGRLADQSFVLHMCSSKRCTNPTAANRTSLVRVSVLDPPRCWLHAQSVVDADAAALVKSWSDASGVSMAVCMRLWQDLRDGNGENSCVRRCLWLR